ncbi:MAG: radical SAM protein [Candidatus Bathyarchaeota archaeon]|nr:radical SAM protein [Candidatus Bathyarchaeota archaeon]
MTSPFKKRDKWHMLKLGAEFDHTSIPIYEAAARGKCTPLLKTLYTSSCQNNCKYCIFRAQRNCTRMTWQPQKLAKVTMHLWKERKICGLFLTSSITKDPDYITEKQLETLQILRNNGYTGYIHLRIMPGTSKHLIKQAAELSDRIGINLEAPNKEVFSELCSDKGGFKEAILKRMEWIVTEAKNARSKTYKPTCGYVKSGVDTQMIVNAIDDNDWQYIQATEWLYERMELKRVYYSGFEPVPQTPLEKQNACPPSREYRLYQVSFLLRDYEFTADDFASVVSDEGFLPNMDPKLAFVKANLDLFPIDLNTASHSEMMRIPRVGPKTAKKIIQTRRVTKIRFSSDLERIIGVNFTRHISHYVDLKDRRLTDFLKTK